MNRKSFALIMPAAFGIALVFSGCAGVGVEVWERDVLAKPEMQLDAGALAKRSTTISISARKPPPAAVASAAGVRLQLTKSNRSARHSPPSRRPFWEPASAPQTELSKVSRPCCSIRRPTRQGARECHFPELEAQRRPNPSVVKPPMTR